MSRRGRSALVLGLALGVVAAAPAVRPRPAGADVHCPFDICIEVERQRPGSLGGPGDGGGGSGSSGGGPACVWVPTSEVQIPGGDAPWGLPMDPGPRPSPEAELVWERCDGAYTGRLVWSDPAAPVMVALPDPRDVALDLRAALERDLPDPAVASDPGAGVPSIVNSPVFVQVTNWQDQVEQEECDATGALCVRVRAVAAMTWTPGEPGAAPVACPGGGSRYDPAGPQPEAQAVGACAHTFRRRTGVAGRPEAWPGQVTITWTVTWASDGDGGSLPDVVKTAAVPRAVGEVQAVVTESR